MAWNINFPRLAVFSSLKELAGLLFLYSRINAIVSHVELTSVVTLEQALDSLKLRLEDPITETVLFRQKNCQDALKRKDLPNACYSKHSLLF